MAHDQITIEFVLKGTSPKQLPIDRLASYLAAVARVVGDPAHTHVLRIKSGSHVTAFAVPEDRYAQTAQRIATANHPELADPGAIKAVRNLQEMVQEDRLPTAYFRSRKVILLTLAGYRPTLGVKLGPIKQRIVVRGRIVGLEGKDNTKHARIVEYGTGREMSGEIVDNELALRLKDQLWQSDVLEVVGQAKRIRYPDGTWETRDFRIESMSIPSQTNLADVFARLRAVHVGSEWSEMADPIAQAKKLRD